jgi:DNA polymerase
MQSIPTEANEAVQELAALTVAVRRLLERRARSGIRLVGCGSAAKPSAVSADKDEHFVSGIDGELFSQTDPAYQTHTLEELRAALTDCRRCKLCAGRTQVVFGVGNPNADLMFIGEGPGRDEDLQGEPFVGRAGQLLTDIITKGMGLKRSDVYIANVVKCRPPENRNPEPDEVAACEPFLRKQIEFVRPEIIVAMGKFAVQALLQTKVPITKLRGHWHRYQGIKLMPTFHPAYLLRNPGDKKLVWEDIKKVIEARRGA